MPLVAIDLPRTMYDANADAVSAGLTQALADALGEPAEETIQIFTPYDDTNPPTRFAGGAGGDVIVGITLARRYSYDDKQELYKQVLVQLGRVGLDPSSVHIPLTENNDYDWSAH
ncbi:tautomerase family protein [Gryllotalpicola reticulitermitis]|uniref:Tautomerase family protein n=1 Tax=Gryllotalpicola reticulitermitis TaxID=1184153 RepID=A0ABV8Q700_9MICO